MADNINGITDLKPPDPLDFETYEDSTGGGKAFVMPPRGVYHFLPTAAPTFGATQEGYLSAMITPLVILDPGKEWDGFEVRYTRVNTKKWPKRNANGFADYLRSHGFQGGLSSNEEYQQAALSLTNHPAHGVADWEVYCKGCGFTLKGMANMPKNEDGTYATRMNCPNCSTAEEKKVLFANVRVVAFTPPEV
jgi:hypothetical protein